MLEAVERGRLEAPSMDEIVPNGVDLATSVFPLHGVDAAGRPALRCRLRRSRMLEVFLRLPPSRIDIFARRWRVTACPATAGG